MLRSLAGAIIRRRLPLPHATLATLSPAALGTPGASSRAPVSGGSPTPTTPTPTPPPPAFPVVGVVGGPIYPLNAVRRELEGSKHAQYARQSGLVPGLIYGIRKRDSAGVYREETLKVYVKESDLRAESNRSKQSFLNTLYDVTVDGKTYRVLPRDLQLHPFKPKFIACNWYLYVPGKYPGTKVDLPLVVANEERCPAIKDGAWLLQLVHKLPVYASGDTIPQALVMDLRGRRMGEKVMASDINLGGFLSLVSGCMNERV